MNVRNPACDLEFYIIEKCCFIVIIAMGMISEEFFYYILLFISVRSPSFWYLCPKNIINIRKCCQNILVNVLSGSKLCHQLSN